MIKKKVKMLANMGYDVFNNEVLGYVQIVLHTKKGYAYSYTMFYPELLMNDGIERIVREINEVIINH